MNQLIEITTVPIEIEMRSSHAKLEYAKASADLEISRAEGGLSIRSRPIRLNMDTFEMRSSVIPTPAQLLLKAKVGEDVMTQIESAALSPDINSQPGLSFIPSTGPDINWDPGEMNIRFEMDKLNFDWRLNQTHFEFVPGDIEISVKQQPDVIIKYIGGPLYVPPSADPNYEPVDVQA